MYCDRLRHGKLETMRTTLYFGGDVYSPADPFATAMLVDGSEVTWVGTDEAAHAIAGDAPAVDLDGALVAPAFVDALADTAGAGADNGVAAAHVTLDPVSGQPVAGAADGPDPADVAVYLDAPSWDAGDLDRWKAEFSNLVGLVGRPGEAGDLAAHFESATAARLQARLRVADDAELARVLDGYDAAASRAGQGRLAASGHRVDIDHAASDELIGHLNASRLSVAVRPGSRDRGGPRTGSMISAGIPVAFGAARGVDGRVDPWGSIRAAVFDRAENERISARAAFTAHTRGGWRAAGRSGDGALVPGAPATFAVWAPTDLLVQVADERIAAWSTDPRSGTPGLPDLTDPDFRPRCLSTVSRGREIYAAGPGDCA